MVLLDLLRKSGKELLVLHVNYGLRGEASDLDEAMIRDYCSQHRLAFESKMINLYALLQSDGGNLQSKARDIRYAYFDAQFQDGDGVFLAHHLDDQIETFFMALTRGGGLRALSCMAEERNYFFRPLLSIEKEELIAYARFHSVPWREDHSNKELTYARNKWRNTFLPEIKTVFPMIGKEVQELVKHFQINLQKIQLKAGTLLSKFYRNGILPFQWMDQEEEVVKELLRLKGLSYGLFDELQKLRNADKGGRIQLNDPDYTIVYREKDHFRFTTQEKSLLPELLIRRVDVLPSFFDKKAIYLDPEKLKGELRIRIWQYGDRMKPIGVKGSKLISDILSDAKVPASEKSSQLVVHDDTKILWCIGYAISRVALASENSQKIKVDFRNNPK
jgi:tRNA(Ile)-lysidine synthase